MAVACGVFGDGVTEGRAGRAEVCATGEASSQGLAGVADEFDEVGTACCVGAGGTCSSWCRWRGIEPTTAAMLSPPFGEWTSDGSRMVDERVRPV